MTYSFSTKKGRNAITRREEALTSLTDTIEAGDDLQLAQVLRTHYIFMFRPKLFLLETPRKSRVMLLRVL